MLWCQTTTRVRATTFLWSVNVAAGTYYVKVAGAEASTKGEYTLAVGFTPDNHGDSAANATSVATPSETEGVLITNDVDYFSLTIAQTGVLSVSTSGDTDTSGVLEDADGNSLVFDDDGGDQDNFAFVRTVSAGTYYVKVTGATTETKGAYSLRVGFVEDSHGDTAAEATTVAAPSNTAAKLTVGDVDYFTFTLDTAGDLTVATTGDADTSGGLEAPAGTTLVTDDDSGTRDNFSIERWVAAGTYFVKVSGSEASSTGDYSLQVGFTTDTHRDTAATATTLAVPSSTTGELSTGDVDYFKLTVAATTVVKISSSGSTDTVGELEDSNGNLLAIDNNTGDGDNFSLAHSVAAGTYFVKVTGAASSTVGAYTLAVSVSAATHVAVSSQTAGELAAGEEDYFSLTVDTPGDLTVATTGGTDTTGVLEDSNGQVLVSDEGSGAGDNFSLTHRVTAGTYYVRVAGADATTAGSYTLKVSLFPVSDVLVTAMPMMVASTTGDYFVLYLKHTDDLELPIRMIRGEPDETTISDVLEPLPVNRYRIEKFRVASPGDIDGDGIDDITELDDLGNKDPLNAGKIELKGASSIDHHGQVMIPDRETFMELSYQGTNTVVDPYVINLEYIKFFLVDVDTDNPSAYFMNTNNYKRHPPFWHAQELGTKHPSANAMKGDLVFHPNVIAPDGRLGVYRFGFQDVDNYSFEEISLAYELLASAMPFLENNLAYYPLHPLAKELYDKPEERAKYDTSRVNVILNKDVIPDVSFVALNQQSGFGLLRKLDRDERPNPRDIVIYESLPNDLPRVAGIITTVQQTPLSHVNLRAIQNAVPNAFIRDALDDDHEVESLIGSHVFYEVTATSYTIRAATSAEVNAHYESLRPAETQTLERDMTETTIKSLSDIGFDDWDAFGVKAANMAELSKLGFPTGTVPVGYAIPFHFYDAFMTANDLHDEVTEMLEDEDFRTEDEDFRTDFAEQEKQLKALRKRIDRGTTPETIKTALEALHANYPVGTSLRYRSSTNNEDLPGFSGAGLYDSKTQDPDETEEDGIDKSIKDVWKSLWNYRAFLEREFHRVAHTSAAMGVLVHPNFSDEKSNGVAVSYDVVNDNAASYYINTQLGEDLVTNPEASSIPEELLLKPDGTYKILARSNQIPPDKLLLTDAQLTQLAGNLTTIHNKFKQLYEVAAGEKFAIEIEFKITKDNVLAIKQARPWVFRGSFGDQGSTRDTTSSVDVPSTTAGELTAGDIDYFTITLENDGDLTVTTTGTTDTSGVLEDSDGNVLVTDADSGESSSFSITRQVSAGTYYIKVTGAEATTTGDYSLAVSFTVDHHGDTAAEATNVELPSQTAGTLGTNDVDYFSVTVDAVGKLQVSTTGGTDTVGILEDADGNQLATDDGSGEGDNFSLTHTVTAGTYYAKVTGAETDTEGDYSLHVSLTSDVEISDALQAEVNEELGRAENTVITLADLVGLTRLIANNNTTLSDLSGLEEAVNLIRLELSHTGVSDLTTLSGLTKLEALRFNNTSVDSLQTLSGLTNLEELWFNNSDVSDISTLANLSELREVRMHRRNSGTAIADIAALVGLSNLEVVEMRGIALDTAMQGHIATLKANGVDVRHDDPPPEDSPPADPPPEDPPPDDPPLEVELSDALRAEVNEELGRPADTVVTDVDLASLTQPDGQQQRCRK